MRHRAYKGALVGGLAAVVAGVVVAAAALQPVESKSVQPSEAERPTLGRWAEVYPLQYGSFAVHDQKCDGQYHSHFDLRTKLLAPAVRRVKPDGQLDTKLLAVQPQDVDQSELEVSGSLPYNTDGYVMVSGLEYDEETGRWYVAPSELDDLSATRERVGCFSCKSTVFNDLYEQEGASLFTQEMTPEFVELLNGQIWNCETCHEAVENPDGSWELSSQADARLTFWTQLARGSFDRLEPGERSCGQCHNSLDHRRYIVDQQTMDGFAPYRYGFGLDALYDAAMADGVYTVDEATGIKLSCLDHPEVELLQGSPMRALGVTCIDCHMPVTADGPDGEAYTSHNASGSPLENEDALAFCLTCHGAQGIQSTDEMAAMVRELQDETTAVAKDLELRLEHAYELILAACGDPATDPEVLDRCREAYSRAEAYVHGTTGSTADQPLGTKVAHNPPAIASYNAQAKALLDEVVSLLS